MKMCLAMFLAKQEAKLKQRVAMNSSKTYFTFTYFI
jgi:hypothetical protein